MAAGTPRIERFGLSPSSGPERVLQFVRPLAAYLAERMDCEVQFAILDSFAEVAEELRAHRISFAWLPPLNYARAADGVQLLLRSVRADSGSYHSALFAREESQLRSAADLAGKHVAWVSRDSLSGYVLPALALREAEVKLGEETFAGSHAAVVKAVKDEWADAGATFCHVTEIDGVQHVISAGWTETVDVGTTRFRVLGRYGPVPGDVLCAAPSVAGAALARFLDAMLHVHEQKGGPEAVRGLFGADRFVEADPGEYRKLRLAAERLT